MANSLSSCWMLSSKVCSAIIDLYGRLDSSTSAVFQQVTLRHHNTVQPPCPSSGRGNCFLFLIEAHRQFHSLSPGSNTVLSLILAVRTCSEGLVIGHQSSPQLQHHPFPHQLLLFWVGHFLIDGPDFFSFFNNPDIHVSSLSCILSLDSLSLDFSCPHWWFNVQDRRINFDDLCWTVSIYLHVKVYTKQHLK